jgi:hypothetical protein
MVRGIGERKLRGEIEGKPLDSGVSGPFGPERVRAEPSLVLWQAYTMKQ